MSEKLPVIQVRQRGGDTVVIEISISSRHRAGAGASSADEQLGHLYRELASSWLDVIGSAPVSCALVIERASTGGTPEARRLDLALRRCSQFNQACVTAKWLAQWLGKHEPAEGSHRIVAAGRRNNVLLWKCEVMR